MFKRYAIFHTPPQGALADFGARWLGWDNVRGKAVAQPQITDVDVSRITATPRKYGMHGTLKAPFRLADGLGQNDLIKAVAGFAASHPPVTLQALALRHQYRFVGLRPVGETDVFGALAADIVRDLDGLRAPMSEAEIARRRAARLSPRQDRQMLDWGYPFIFEDFNFHLTLTGTISPQEGAEVIAALEPLVMPLLPAPYPIDAITLMGEDSEGMFHQIERFALTG